MNNVAYDKYTIPESKTAARGGLTSAAKVDFKKSHPPLLITSGSEDTIIPAHLNIRNYNRYVKNDWCWITRSSQAAITSYWGNRRGKKMRIIFWNGLVDCRF